MLCVCAGIHATREIVGATAIVAPCPGVPKSSFWEKLPLSKSKQLRMCKDKDAWIRLPKMKETTREVQNFIKGNETLTRINHPRIQTMRGLKRI